METLVIVKLLLSVWGNADLLKKFVIYELSTILSTISDTEFNSAIRALKDAKRSKDPDSHIRSAVTNLRTAFVAATSNYKNMNRLQSFWHGTGESLTRAYKTALMIAACYKHLKDKNLEIDYMKEARTYFEQLLKDTAYMPAKEEEKMRSEVAAFRSLYQQSTGVLIPFDNPVYIHDNVNMVTGEGHCPKCKAFFPFDNGVVYESRRCVSLWCLHCPKCYNHIKPLK